MLSKCIGYSRGGNRVLAGFRTKSLTKFELTSFSTLTQTSSNIVPRSILEHFPKHPPQDENVWPTLDGLLKQDDRRLVVLDDNLSGIATVYDTNILLDYSVSAIEELLMASDDPFYIITNTRSLSEREAARVIRKIMYNLTQAVMMNQYARPVQIVSRMDSTLRCHYPTVVSAVQENVFVGCDSIILAPQTFEGGRVTFNDIHYIEDMEKDEFVPVHMTSYAQDNTFGYTSSHLGEWVVQKGKGSIDTSTLISITLQDIREGGPLAVQTKLENAPVNATVIVNALHNHDMDVFIMGLLLAESNGSQFLYSVGSSFVARRMGLAWRNSLSPAKLSQMMMEHRKSGGLMIVDRGTQHISEQVQYLTDRVDSSAATHVKVEAARVLWASPKSLQAFRAEIVAKVESELAKGKEVILSFSPVGAPKGTMDHADEQRDNASASSGTSDRVGEWDGNDTGSLGDSVVVSRFASSVLRGLAVQPRYVLTTGGCTAYQVAAQGAGIVRGLVLGQVIEGVSIWRAGDDSALPGLHCITFPDNIAALDALARVARRLGTDVSDEPVVQAEGMYERVVRLVLPQSQASGAPEDKSDATNSFDGDREGDIDASGVATPGSAGVENFRAAYLRRLDAGTKGTLPLLLGFDVATPDMAAMVLHAAVEAGVGDVLLRPTTSASMSMPMGIALLGLGASHMAGAPDVFTSLPQGCTERAVGLQAHSVTLAGPCVPRADAMDDKKKGEKDIGDEDHRDEGMLEVPSGVAIERSVVLSIPFTDDSPTWEAFVVEDINNCDVLEVTIDGLSGEGDRMKTPTDKDVDVLCRHLMELSAASPHRPIALRVHSVEGGLLLMSMLAERPRTPPICRLHFSEAALTCAADQRVGRLVQSATAVAAAVPPYTELARASSEAVRKRALEALSAAGWHRR